MSDKKDSDNVYKEQAERRKQPLILNKGRLDNAHKRGVAYQSVTLAELKNNGCQDTLVRPQANKTAEYRARG